jgi:autotransporter-associated beta strand protein
MKTTLTNSNSSAFVRLIYTAFTAAFLPALLLLLSIQPSHAASATWQTNPPTNDWHIANNWSPQTVPDGPSDTATFATSNTTAISIADTSDFLTELAGMTFNSGASAYTLTLAQDNALYIEGAGVINNSGLMQTITINGAVDISHGPAQVLFTGGDAGSATFVAEAGLNGGLGGSIFFQNDSTGGTSRIEVFGNENGDLINGHLDIGQHLAPGVTIGSLEGNGFVQLGANELTVGANNLTTAFSGLIKDGGSGGSLAKIGRGRFTLNKGNTYTGGTTVTQGTLLVGNGTGSGTGTGPVAINAGTLGGTGKISGTVTIGTATTAAMLAPGSRAELGTLKLSNTLTFNARGNYKADLNSTLVRTDQVTAKGVTINSGATATITDLGTGTLTTGTVLTIINNTANTPISGTFSNLADGSTLVIGSNTYLVSYEGGTGNDLTLTVQ